MSLESYFYNCSRDYVHTIDPTLHEEIESALLLLPKKKTQSQINRDLFWLLTSRGWSYDALPAGLGESPPEAFHIGDTLDEVRKRNERALCLTSTTLEARWASDFAKRLRGGLVQVEAQFGKTEAMFKDFCGFQIAYAEKRLALGIEVVMHRPDLYFKHRKAAISGMARYDIAKETLSAIGLNCPIWLIGIG